MNRYTKDEILGAVRRELIAANKALRIANGFTDKDYTYLGVVAAAIERLDNEADLLLKKRSSKRRRSSPKGRQSNVRKANDAGSARRRTE